MTNCDKARRRIRFDAVVCCKGQEEALQGAALAIVGDLTHLYGGASAQSITGGWAVNGNETRTEYNTIAIEPGFKVSLSVLEADSESAFAHLQKVITLAIGSFDLPVQFVHVERTATEALHFDASTHNFCGARATANQI
jgi:hypothetical protein